MPRTPESFVRSRRDAWSRLHDLIDRSQSRHTTALTNTELHEMGMLYRRASADLARAQTHYSSTNAGRELVRSLNTLVLRAHAQVYAAPAVQPTRAWQFFLYEFPAAFRRNWRSILLAALLLYGPAVAAYITVWNNPNTSSLFMDDSLKAIMKERARKKLVTGWGGNLKEGGIMGSPEGNSSYIMTHNIKTTVMAVALGFTAGVGTIYVLVGNGLMLGALSAVAGLDKVNLLYWAVILPHGVLELSAICISGGAGFLLARALYAPGDLPRRDSLRLAGHEAGKLLAGVAFMLVFAGLIEGFITPTALPPQLKLSFAALTALVLVLWLSLHAPDEAANKVRASR